MALASSASHLLITPSSAASLNFALRVLSFTAFVGRILNFSSDNVFKPAPGHNEGDAISINGEALMAFRGS